MALSYTVLGAGAMGLRFGVLLQELTGVKVDFVDNWQPQVDTIKEQGGVYVSRDHENPFNFSVNFRFKCLAFPQVGTWFR